MNRRKFIHRAALTSVGAMGIPYILPSGRLFAATGNRKANHVVFCLFAGGVRNLEAVHKNDGNLMPNMLKGSEAISSDISGSLKVLPTGLLPNPLQTYGTLYKEFRFDNGPTGHVNGHITAMTGQYTTTTLDIRNRPSSPTLFELYRKHSNPNAEALKAWWITASNNFYPLMNHSVNPSYGALYGANEISPNTFFNYNLLKEIEDVWASGGQDAVVDDLNNFLNYNFFSGTNLQSGVKNGIKDTEQIQAWITKKIGELKSGNFSNPWQIPGGMNSDMRNIMWSEEVIKEFKPELMVVNMFAVDVAHTNFSKYCNALQYADYATAHLWNTIQNTPGMANDTVLIVVPEIGRNGVANSIIDPNGRAALDHTSSDPVAREIFCLIAGPQGVVKQDIEITTTMGKTVDVVPTIADILGFYNEVSGSLPGAKLTQAFV